LICSPSRKITVPLRRGIAAVLIDNAASADSGESVGEVGDPDTDAGDACEDDTESLAGFIVDDEEPIDYASDASVSVSDE